MATWQSFDPFQALHREIENAFERAGPQYAPMFRSAFLPGRAAREYPLVNLYEEQDYVRVEALAPGAEPESFNISMVGRTLNIAGEKRRVPDDVKPEAFHREERAAESSIGVLKFLMMSKKAKVSAASTNTGYCS